MSENMFGSAMSAEECGLFASAPMGAQAAEQMFGSPAQTEQKMEVVQEVTIHTPEATQAVGVNAGADMEKGGPAKVTAVQAPITMPQADEKQESMDGGPLAAALAQQDLNEAKTVFDKKPMFSYKESEEEITDLNMTFEDLRVAKAGDFPILDDPHKVTWEVCYGKTRKKISTPKTTKIGAAKKEIEMAAGFLTEVKADKEGKLRCRITPTIKAQTKGEMAAYKGLFATQEEAQASDKSICLIPGSDGKLFELRKTAAGEFITPSGAHKDLEEIRAGFYPALPRVPYDILAQIMSFFRSVMDGREYGKPNLEALANIYWDIQEQRYIVHVPQQVITHTSVDTDLTEAPDEERYIHYADVHSHNNMPAIFSDRDNRDEKDTRVYIVMGELDRLFPSIQARISNGGKFYEIDLERIVEPMPTAAYDPAWKEQLTYAGGYVHQTQPYRDFPDGLKCGASTFRIIRVGRGRNHEI